MKKPLRISKNILSLVFVTGLFISATSSAQNYSIENPNNKPVKRKVVPKPAPATPTPIPAPSMPSDPTPPAYLRHSVTFAFGQSYLFGDFSDLGEEKVIVDLFYHYRASYIFQFQLNIHSHEFTLSGQSIRLSSANAAIKAKLYDFDSFAPYILGGLGLYWPEADRFIGSTLTNTDSDTTMGLNFGAGMDLYLNQRFATGFLLHYHLPFRLKYDDQPSLSGHYMKLLVTLTYSFM